MKVKWTKNAIAHLASIYEMIEADSPRYAISVVDRITRRTGQISEFPMSGQMVPEYQAEEIREIIEYSYRILYLVDDSVIYILALIHRAKPLPDTPPSIDG